MLIKRYQGRYRLPLIPLDKHAQEIDVPLKRKMVISFSRQKAVISALNRLGIPPALIQRGRSMSHPGILWSHLDSVDQEADFSHWPYRKSNDNPEARLNRFCR